MKPLCTTAAWACVAAVLIGFLLPWAAMDIGTSKVGDEVTAGARKSLAKSFGVKQAKEPSWIRKRAKPVLVPTRVSGLQIPVVANRKGVKVVTQLAKLFTKTDEQLGFKSYAVYLLPGLALICGWLIAAHGSQRPTALAVAALSAFVAGGGFWVLLTSDPRAEFGIRIGAGLWLSLWGYAGLALAAVALVLPSTLQERILERLTAGRGR